MIPLNAQAGLWGLIAGSALLIGAAAGYFLKVPKKIVASIMAFGSGVLISALAFDLMDEAYKMSGIVPAALGFISGASLFTGINFLLTLKGARHRKRSGTIHPKKNETTGLALAAGALLDGIPESIVLGLSLLKGGTISLVALVAIFLSNIPEGLSSAVGMKRSGRKAIYIFGVWGIITLVSGISAFAGYALFRNVAPAYVAASTAVAAGAILAMIADTMIPEAFEDAHVLSGLITALGFISAFFLTKALT